MGKIVKILIVCFASLNIIKCVQAQRMDTIYIIDFYDFKYGSPWSKESKHFVNKGTTIQFNDSVEIFLKAGYRDTKLKFLEEGTWIPYPIRIQSLRLIVPENTCIPLHIKSEKIISFRGTKLDTVLTFNPNIISEPYWFIGYILQTHTFLNFTLDFNLTNRDFAWKNSYKRPKTYRSVFNSVKYEYNLSNSELKMIK